MRFNLRAGFATLALLAIAGGLAFWLLTPDPPPPCEAVASHCAGDGHYLGESAADNAVATGEDRPRR